MTLGEFQIFTKGALNDLLVYASIVLEHQLPRENIRLMYFQKVLAEGWDESVDFLVSNTYFSENEIKPCVDLTVYSFDETTTTVWITISAHAPRPFGLNWNGTAGPFIKLVNNSLIQKYASKKFLK